jgi:hypothetical protein
MQIRQGGILALLFAAGGTAALAGSLEMAQPLFVIERNTNANVVHYDARLAPGGNLDPNRPVTAYWVMAAEDGRREELNSYERNRVYGFNIEPGSDGSSYHMELVSQRRRDIFVYRRGDSVYAETTIAGRKAYLNKVYVNAKKVLAVPTVKSIELFGTDVETGQPLREVVQP